MLGKMISMFAAVLAMAIGGSGAPAHEHHSLTGPAAFLAAEHPHDDFWGGPSTDKQLLSIGYTTCDFHNRGLSDLAVHTAMMGGPSMVSPDGSVARDLGLQRVRNAVRYLCP